MLTDDNINHYKQLYKDIVAQAGDDQELIELVYKEAVKQLAELSVVAKLEEDKKDLIIDLLVITEIVEMTAEVFDKTTNQVSDDILSELALLPFDDIQIAHDLKQSGMLN